MKKIILSQKEKKEESVSMVIKKERQNPNSEKKEKLITRIEDSSKRSIYAKHYVNNNGTFTMEVSPSPIHYYDSKRRKYEEIDNTFIEEDESIKIKNNSFNIDFAKELDNSHLFKLRSNNNEIGFNFKGKKDKNKILFKKSKAKHQNENKLSGSLVYDEIAPDTDLEYIVSSDRIKENIIVKRKQDTYIYEFELMIDNLGIKLSEDGNNIDLFDEETTQTLYFIPTPVMIDANNQESYDVTYEFEEQEFNALKLIISANSNWINASERKFPVKIDPQIVKYLENSTKQLEYYSVENNIVKEKLNSSIIISPNNNAKKQCIINIDLSSFKKDVEIVSGKLTSQKLVTSNTILTAAIHNPPLISEIDFLNKPLNGDYEPLNVSVTKSLSKRQSGYILTNDQEGGVIDTTVSSVENYSINLLANINNILKKGQSNLSILLSGVEGTSLTISIPLVSITYKYKSRSPKDYLALDTGSMMEIVINHITEIAEVDYTINGVLTTYIDKENKKVYQQCQLQEKLFMRTNNNLTVWGKWERVGKNMLYSNGVLTITD